ncbi:penicillin-binding protein 2 [Thiomicrospira sp. ALE5]|nr:penicillin-binding protein 2 [Thiomicrospira sp. ALE5]
MGWKAAPKAMVWPFKNRLIFALLIILLAFSGLIARMVYLQYHHHETYLELAEGNRISVQAVAPERGKIYDRNGQLVADNQPVFSLSFTRERIPDLQASIDNLALLLPDIDQERLSQFSQRITRLPRHQTHVFPTSLTDEQAAIFAAHNHRFPGIQLTARQKRVYPHGQSTAHLVGYVGRISEQDLPRIDRARYRATSTIGKSGLERFYEDQLHGYPGLRRVETNARGRVIRILEHIPATPGEDLHLTVDIRLQQFLEQELSGWRAAAVAIEPSSGEVLAFVSTPSFDANLFVDGISHNDYNSLLTDPRRPLINRASRGLYPPGSTTKPITALGALELGYTNMTRRIFDPGYFEFQDRRYHNWRREGHGWTDLKRSIVESVDTYYYKMSLDMGIDTLHDILAPFGFGKRTGIDHPGEQAGILPSQAWKRAVHGEAWFRGETIISSIGQGYNLITPLQLAHATSILANRGQVVTPHFNQAIEPKVDQLAIENRQHWEYVIDGMVDSVHTPRGTAWSSGRQIEGYKIAGKTGTAQVFSLNDQEYREEELDQRLHNHALFVAFAPAHQPNIAISIIVENGGGGGRTAAPIGVRAIDYYLRELR